MIIVINDNVINGVKTNTMGYPVIPDVYLDKLKSDSSCEWPYVYIPSITPSQRVECELGYWNNANLSKKVCPIVYDNVSIQSIYISLEKKQIYEWSGGFQYAIDKYKLYYHYEITLLLKNDINCCNYKFESDDYIEINYRRKECPKMGTMKRLFSTIIPMLNEFISEGHPVNLLNRSYIQSCFPLKGNDYIERCYTHDYNRFKQIIYSSRMKIGHGAYFLEIGKGVMPFVNHHVADIISNILGVKFLRDSSDEYIYGIVTKLLEEIDHNESMLLPYCMAKLFFNAERFYSSDIANKDIMLAVSSDINSPVIKKTIGNLYIPTIDVVKAFDFIYNIDAEHKMEGEYRVGRDDREWEAIRFRFPIREDYTPSSRLISLINAVLAITLEFKEEKPRCYHFAQNLNSDYVPWRARNEDWGSAELKESSMNKIFDRFYTLFKSDVKDFEQICKE